MTGDACGCKVSRVADRRDLGDLDAELRHRRDEGASLRDLADVVNTRVLESGMNAVDADVVGDAASVYEALTGDDVDPTRHADVRDQLEYAGVDVESVSGDFVSHQTVRDHLRDCLGLDTGRDGVETVQEGREVVTWARERNERVVERTLQRLGRTGALELGELDVFNSTTVTCEDCGSSFGVEELLDRGGCDCGREDA